MTDKPSNRQERKPNSRAPNMPGALRYFEGLVGTPLNEQSLEVVEKHRAYMDYIRAGMTTGEAMEEVERRFK